MSCYLLHVLEQQDLRPYDDPDVKDVVGTMPQFYCTRQHPIAPLRPGEAIKCIERDTPCPDIAPAPAKPPTPDPWDPRNL